MYPIVPRWGKQWETDGVQNVSKMGYRTGDRWGTEWETDVVQNWIQMRYRMGD
jgi:hypothetical protein